MRDITAKAQYILTRAEETSSFLSLDIAILKFKESQYSNL